MKLRARAVSLLSRLQRGPGWGLGRIPPGRALHRVLKALRLGSAPVPVTLHGITVYVAPDDEQVGAELLRNGAYEPNQMALFRATVRTGMTVVDAGANVGVYSLVAAELVGPAGRVIGFEPDPETVKLLKRGVTANGFANVTVAQVALAAENGEVELFRLAHNPGLSSLAQRNARRTADHVLVRKTTLDAELAVLGIDRIDVLKLDVQGGELGVLEGAGATIARNRPTLFLEFWPGGLRNCGSDPHELLELLRALGYSLRSVGAPEVELSLDEIESAQYAIESRQTPETATEDFVLDLIAVPRRESDAPDPSFSPGRSLA